MIYLVRHGETTWNRVGRQQGHDDSPLTETGIEQARAAGRVLQRAISDVQLVCIETSPLGRARQTALIINEVLGLDPNAILVTPLLIEHHLGSWQGLTHSEIDERYPGAWQAREENKWEYVVPGGESYVRVAERAKQWLASKRYAPITIAVTHAIISRTIQGAYGGFTPSETVARSHRQDRIYRLHAGLVEEISCEV
ncbi:MAG TPA: histidine phosphatase family protein [Candidatus Binatia bacterium]|nr:histidine phosphatase family protein [Candidatus Binatia bacterium]